MNGCVLYLVKSLSKSIAQLDEEKNTFPIGLAASEMEMIVFGFVRYRCWIIGVGGVRWWEIKLSDFSPDNCILSSWLRKNVWARIFTDILLKTKGCQTRISRNGQTKRVIFCVFFLSMKWFPLPEYGRNWNANEFLRSYDVQSVSVLFFVSIKRMFWFNFHLMCKSFEFRFLG